MVCSRYYCRFQSNLVPGSIEVFNAHATAQPAPAHCATRVPTSNVDSIFNLFRVAQSRVTQAHALNTRGNSAPREAKRKAQTPQATHTRTSFRCFPLGNKRTQTGQRNSRPHRRCRVARHLNPAPDSYRKPVGPEISKTY